MKRIHYLLALLASMILISGCGDQVTSTPTPTNISPVEIAGTMMQVQVAAEATQNALNIQRTATAQIIGATSTYQAAETQIAVTQQARIDAQSTADQIRRDAQATQARIDMEATQVQSRIDMEATVAQARLDVESTQQAGATATAGIMTMTAIPPASTLTQIANEQSILLANNQVELSNLAVEQQRQKNTPEWLVPFLIAISVTIVGAVYVIRYSRVREVKNDDGDVELLILDGDRALRPQLMPGPVVEMGDVVSMPLLTAPGEQSKVTERAQAVQAIKNMPASTTPQAAQTFNKYFGSRREEMFEIIDGEEMPPAGLLDGETVKALNNDWKEAKGE